MKTLRTSQKVTEAIYTGDEIKKLMLKGLDKEGLKAIHRIKETFENSSVEKVEKAKRSETRE